MTPDRSLARHQRIYRTLLLLYPRAFRQVYGADMVQVFGDRLREEREGSGNGATIAVWLRTLLDLFKSAPVQRMEKKMSREAAFGILFALFLAFAVATFAMGSVPPIVTIGLGVLIVVAIGLGMAGSFRKDRTVGHARPGETGPWEWWVVLAAVAGLLEIGFGATLLIQDPKIENVFALAVLSGFGLLTLAGAWFRSRSRSGGDWMIVVGLLPCYPFFWMIVPPLLAVPVTVMALIDSARVPKTQTS